MENRVGWTNIFFSHDDTNARGRVAILFKSSKMYKVKKLVSMMRVGWSLLKFRWVMRTLYFAISMHQMEIPPTFSYK